ncbi:hypothetical protein ACFV0W_21205, partial [Streptomyces anulatus]
AAAAAPGATPAPAASSVPAPGTAPDAAPGAPVGAVGPGAGRGDAGFEPYDFLPTDPWHEKDFREARWASLKRGSGGLMADFPADPADPVGLADPADPVGLADPADPVGPAGPTGFADSADFAAGRPASDPDRPGPTP